MKSAKLAQIAKLRGLQLEAEKLKLSQAARALALRNASHDEQLENQAQCEKAWLDAASLTRPEPVVLRGYAHAFQVGLGELERRRVAVADAEEFRASRVSAARSALSRAETSKALEQRALRIERRLKDEKVLSESDDRTAREHRL